MEAADALRLALVVVIIVIIIALCYYKRRKDKFSLRDAREVQSSIDGLKYKVHLTHGEAARAADVMAILNARSIRLLAHLKKKYGEPGRYPERHAATKRLLARYNPDHLAENSPRDPDGDTSYTINKGHIVALCLREKDPSRTGLPGVHDFHNFETLTFVTFHELAHIAVAATGHPPEFWQAFKFLIQDAIEAGILKGVNYSEHSEMYCGMNINYTPLFDPTVISLV